MAAYQNRLTAFVDVLGWKELIRRSETNPEIVSAISEVMGTIHGIATDDDFQFAAFSDSVAMSQSFGPSTMEPFLIGLAAFYLGSLQAGFVLRGGVTLGPLSHKGNIIFGPAMIRAYHLESSAAVYPRIVLDPEIAWPNVSPALARMITQDADGLPYLDALSPFCLQLLSHHSGAQEGLVVQNVRRVVDRNLEITTEPSVRAKFGWMKSQLDRLWA